MATLDLIISLVIGFAILVFFHELGHFLFAKLFKMRVEEFALGMGKPKLRVFHDGETEYNLRAFPLGGFVRISGMEVEDEAEQRIANFGAKKSTTSDAEVPAPIIDDVVIDDAQGFYNRPIWQRYLVILAGPVFSILLGWFVLCLMGVTVGQETGKISNKIVMVVRGGVADKAGLHVGDRIAAIDGVPTEDGDRMVKTIQGAAGKSLTLTVADRDGKTKSVPVTPKAEDFMGKTIGRIGIQPGAITERVGLGQAIEGGTYATLNFYRQLFGMFQHGKVRENIGGPIAIVGMTRQAVDMGAFYKMGMLGQLSLSLAFFNLLPIPILDGGHLTLFTIEAIRGKRLTAQTTQRVLLAGFALLMVFVAFVLVNDVSRLFGKS